jgi:hypothetical protein
MKRAGLWITLIFCLAFLAIMFTSTRGLSTHRVEVCVEYQGHTACRIASAASRDEALRTARDNACAQIASGMTDSIACQNELPKRVTWLDAE